MPISMGSAKSLKISLTEQFIPCVYVALLRVHGAAQMFINILKAVNFSVLRH